MLDDLSRSLFIGPSISALSASGAGKILFVLGNKFVLRFCNFKQNLSVERREFSSILELGACHKLRYLVFLWLFCICRNMKWVPFILSRGHYSSASLNERADVNTEMINVCQVVLHLKSNTPLWLANNYDFVTRFQLSSTPTNESTLP